MPFRRIRSRCTALACTLPLALAAAPVLAQSASPTTYSGKLLLTGGVSSIDGAAGGGLTPWAVTGGYATAGEIGGSAFATHVKTKDFALNDLGATFSYGERIELSLARQDFDAGPVGPALGMNGLHLKQNIFGAKLRVAGDAVLDSDSWMPQIAVGVQHKKAHPDRLGDTLTALGAKHSGTDFYISATKLFLAPGVLINGTLRATKANQNGLLGFGATDHSSYSLQPEVSVAYLLSKSIAIGAEYRAKPDNFRDVNALGAGALKEDDWADVFIAWAPSKHFSLTAAYVDLGKIVPGVVTRRQTGTYLSAQIAF